MQQVPARIITNEGVREVSDRELFSSIFGHPPRTKAERQAEWDAEVALKVELIDRGCDLSEYGNPAVREAKEIIARRQARAA